MFWCSFKKKEFPQGVLDCLKLVDLDFMHLDQSSGRIKLQTLWFFSVYLVMGVVISIFGPNIVVLVSRSYSRTFEPYIWSLLRLLSHNVTTCFSNKIFHF